MQIIIIIIITVLGSENQGVSKALFLLEVSGEKSIFLPFPAFRVCLHSLDAGYFLQSAWFQPLVLALYLFFSDFDPLASLS